MVKKNEHDLSRYIPSEVKRQIRKRCGFGCVICGNAFYHYEHIDDFAGVEKHDPDAMTLLCGGCHDKVTRGFWSKDKVRSAASNPKCASSNWASVAMDIGEQELLVRVGETSFIGLKNVILIDGVELFSITNKKESREPPIVSAKFFDRNNFLIGKIEENIWSGSTEAFDIQTVGSRITVSSSLHKLDLILSMQPPNELHIEKINMQYNGKVITGDSASGFVVRTAKAELKMPSKHETVENAPYWLSITDSTVHVASGSIVSGVNSTGEHIWPGVTLGVENANIEVGTAEEFGITGFPPGKKLIRLTSGAEGMASLEMTMRVKATEIPKSPIGRNSRCSCGSQQRYKNCCGRLV